MVNYGGDIQQIYSPLNVIYIINVKHFILEIVFIKVII